MKKIKELDKLLKKEESNKQMYMRARVMHKNVKLTYGLINVIFNLESRMALDLENLRDYIVVATTLDSKNEQAHELMTVLTQAIDSVLFE